MGEISMRVGGRSGRIFWRVPTTMEVGATVVGTATVEAFVVWGRRPKGREACQFEQLPPVLTAGLPCEPLGSDYPRWLGKPQSQTRTV